MRLVPLKLDLIQDLEVPLLHRVADRRQIAANDHVDGAYGVAQHAAEMIGPDGMHHPGAGSYRLSFLPDRIDEDEFAFLVVAADAVDDQPVWAVEGDPDDVVGVALAGEEPGHVELGRIGRTCRSCGKEERGSDELHW